MTNPPEEPSDKHPDTSLEARVPEKTKGWLGVRKRDWMIVAAAVIIECIPIGSRIYDRFEVRSDLDYCIEQLSNESLPGSLYSGQETKHNQRITYVLQSITGPRTGVSCSKVMDMYTDQNSP